MPVSNANEWKYKAFNYFNQLLRRSDIPVTSFLSRKDVEYACCGLFYWSTVLPLISGYQCMTNRNYFNAICVMQWFSKCLAFQDWFQLTDIDYYNCHSFFGLTTLGMIWVPFNYKACLNLWAGAIAETEKHDDVWLEDSSLHSSPGSSLHSSAGSPTVESAWCEIA